jgi:hypothetical protein
VFTNRSTWLLATLRSETSELTDGFEPRVHLQLIVGHDVPPHGVDADAESASVHIRRTVYCLVM